MQVVVVTVFYAGLMRAYALRVHRMDSVLTLDLWSASHRETVPITASLGL